MLGSIIGSVISSGAGLLGGLLAPKPDYKAAARDAFKGEFNARMGAAQKYGISKLVMAGAPAVGGSPMPVGNPIGQAISDMGADVGRAVQANLNQPERQILRAQLDKLGSENELVKAQARNINLRTIREATPPMPTPGVFGHRMEPPAMTTHIRGGGYNIPASTNWSDADTYERRYGETVSDWLVGPMIFADDMVRPRFGYQAPPRVPYNSRYSTGGSF